MAYWYKDARNTAEISRHLSAASSSPRGKSSYLTSLKHLVDYSNFKDVNNIPAGLMEGYGAELDSYRGYNEENLIYIGGWEDWVYFPEASISYPVDTDFYPE
jgi:hypothetical protein